MAVLQCIGDADQASVRARLGVDVAECEGAIVEAAAHAEAHAVRIEADERQEHQIEPARADARGAAGSTIPR